MRDERGGGRERGMRVKKGGNEGEEGGSEERIKLQTKVNVDGELRAQFQIQIMS